MKTGLRWWHGIQGDAQLPPHVDTPGTLMVDARTSGRNFLFDITLRDVDGITAIATAEMEARDGTTSDITLVRRSGTEWGLSISRRNARWRAGFVRVTYQDALNGPQSLTTGWSL